MIGGEPLAQRKKRLQSLLLTIASLGLVITGMSGVTRAATESSVNLSPNAKAAILLDATTGTVLYAKNEHARLPIASVTKVATMLLIMEAIERGQVKLSDPVRTSEHAASMGGSQIFLEPGEQMTLRDMLKGIALASANDAAVAVAEHIAGSEQTFVQMMNSKVKTMQLVDTHFSNTNGLPVHGHYSSAYDIAQLSRELLKHDGITAFTGVYSDYLRKGSTHPFWLVNTNKLVRFYSGMDGIKTGFTADAKYCLAASAKRNEFRVIAVVLGEPSSKVRNAEVTSMMNYAFSNYGIRQIYHKGQIIAMVPISRGEWQAVGGVATRSVGVLVNKMDRKETGSIVTELQTLTAPIKKGQVIGHIRLLHEGKSIDSVPVVATADVARVSLFEMIGRAMKRMLLFGVTR